MNRNTFSHFDFYLGLVNAFGASYAAKAAVGNPKVWIGAAVCLGLLSIYCFMVTVADRLASDIAKELKKKE